MAAINGPEELSVFRDHWNGKRMLDLLQQHEGRLLVELAVGVGKSHNIDLVIEETVSSGRYDLVIALFPTRQIIDERKWVLNPPSDSLGLNTVRCLCPGAWRELPVS
jgi:hypothetical protein